MVCITSILILGIKVDYAAEIAGIPPGECLIRCLIKLWTGDYPAQCEVGKTINKGIHPCRRCELTGIILHHYPLRACMHSHHNTTCTCMHLLGERYPRTTQYYYGKFRYQNCHPWPERILSNCLKDMIRVEGEDNHSCIHI